jgi:hypothetical protein
MDAPASTHAPHPRYLNAEDLPEFIWRTFGVNISESTVLRYRHKTGFHALPATEAAVRTWWETQAFPEHQRCKAVHRIAREHEGQKPSPAVTPSQSTNS